MDIQNAGQLGAQASLIFTTGVELGLQQAFTNPPAAKYQKICKVATVSRPGGMLGKHIPSKVVFPWAPPVARMETMTENGGRTVTPLVRNNLTLDILPRQVAYGVNRTAVYNDVYSVIPNVVDNLMRPVVKDGDVLTAAVLRNGKVLVDYTGGAFFATGKVVSLAGATTLTYNNLHTGRKLTAQNVAYGVSYMKGLKGEDTLSLDIQPDTLIVPPGMFGAAMDACKVLYGVYSAPDNAWRGQAANTAAMGQNWVASSGVIKQIIEMPELTDGGASIDETTWYLAECDNPARGGAWGLIFGEDPSVEVAVITDPQSSIVFEKNQVVCGAIVYHAAGPGIGQFIHRFEE